MVTTHITRRFNSVAGKSFKPLGVGAGERRPSCSHYPKPRGMSFNPLGGGAGAWDDPTIRQLRRREESFQSPRSWGGVGLETASPGPTTSVITLRAYLRQRLMLISYASSHIQHMQKAIERFLFQSPRSWGGVGLLSCSSSTVLDTWTVSIPSELGRGRALHVSAVDDTKVHRSVSFQSPRRWGGVGLPAHAEGHGANLGQRVSIPSEVGRGRAGPSGKPCSTPSCLVSIPSEVGRGRALFEAGFVKKTNDEFQSPRRWGGVGLVVLEDLLLVCSFK